MKIGMALAIGVVALVAGCTASVDGTGGADSGQAGNIPDAVAAMAAPGQNLSTARFLPEDGCYWYRHAGPVETTLLPLRTTDGRPICARSPS